MKELPITAILLSLTTAILSGCANEISVTSAKTNNSPSVQAATAVESNPTKPTEKAKDETSSNSSVSAPDSITVLVNKQHGLSEQYEPADLVEPNIPFTFKEKNEKRKMRKEAAQALEKLFAGAKKDGILLAGVSAYRSFATQKTLFNRYVQQDGMDKAKMYSAVPGYSEHETGLAIDVTGINGKCAAEDCFGGTKEADWLDKHAEEYGYIIRYPKGKEAITGYQYEPWHIRYVGIKAAQEISQKGITLEEYVDGAKKM